MNCEVIARDDKRDDYFGQSHVSCKEVILRKSESFSPPSPTSTDPPICLTVHLLSMHSVHIYLSLTPSTTHPAHIHPNRRPHIINSCKVKRVSLNSVLFANISSTRHRQLVIKHSCITGKVALKSRAEDVEDDVHEQEDDDANRGHMRVGDMDDDGHGQGGEDDSRMNVHLALFTSAPLIADIIIIIIIIHPFHKFTFRVSSFAPFLRQSPQLISPSACTPSMGQTMALRISPSRQTLKSILPVMYSWGTSHQLLFPSRRAASPTSDKE
ncbi:hypothetical protein EmuJ_001142900 [Echinococcus multilocularis]|uniref:Uncharacterized protein n=1 Tax=Echinococcus multilocularis TaxID=6211 RepID=A0A068YNQ8_ECHMU|nr:hypothetical protein EmuJ_001142900 [Echinococcus multilocularis]